MQLTMRRIANADITKVFRYDWSHFLVDIPTTESAGVAADKMAHDVSERLHGVTEKADAVKTDANRKVRDVVDMAHKRASSATYALFIVAGLLLVSLIIVLLFSNLQ